ncbi:FtsX-like permease family protein, partial [Gemmatimonadota bacterium]
VIGKDIDLSGTVYRVVGVAAEGFRGSTYTSNVDIWIPVVMRRAIEPPEGEVDIVQSDWSWIHIIGRLKAGTTLDQARARVNAIVAGSNSFREDLKERTVTIQPIRKTTIIPTLRERTVAYLAMLLFASGLVALVVCVNLTNLFAGRMDERRAEISIRRALGAGNWMLIRQYLVESGLIALFGGIGAVIIASWLDSVLFSLLAPGMNLSTSVISVEPDLRVLGFTFGLVVLSSTIIGLIPALRDRSSRISISLRPGPGTTDSRYRFLNLQNVLVMSQLTLSLVLLVSGGLMIRSLSRLLNQDPGFTTKNMMTVSIDNERMLLDEESCNSLYRSIVDRVGAIPGIEDVSLTKVSPLSGITWGGIMHFEGFEPGPDERSHAAENFVDPGFFRMMGIQLLRGRGFTDQDLSGSEQVVIVNQTLVDRYWPDSDPLGKTVRWWAEEGDGETFRVIGVVGDHIYSRLSLGVVPLTYYPLSQHFLKNPVLLAHTISEPYQMLPAITSAIREISPGLNPFDLISIDDQVHAQGARSRATMILLLSYASLALLLSVMGTYGVMSGMITRRKQEIGIRIALGARREEVVRFMLARGMRLVVTALAIGVIVALGATTIMRSQVFGISTADPVTYISVAIILAAAGFLACLIPARRVVKIDPIESLRAE